MPFSVTSALRAPARALLSLLVVATTLAALPAGQATAIPIEGYPSYQPQQTCSPTAKRGTVTLADHLVTRYRGSGSLGISRSCTASGVSEHKEGRAFDWKLSATSARDRGYARDFIARLRATDGKGNRNALARRMGIMYLIWNDHIWSASSGYRRRDYLHGACSTLSSCSTTLRHRDHMHISLSRRAARGRTSWYVARSTAPAPKPAPKPAPRPAPKPDPLPDGVVDLREQPYRVVRVPANGEAVVTRWKLQGGVTYSLTAAGLYSFGRPSQVGDAVCTWASREEAWVPRPRTTTARRFGRLALAVNGDLVFGDTCNTRGHTYRTTITPAKDQYLRAKVLGKHRRSTGRLTLVVGRPRARVADALPTYPTLTSAPRPTAPAAGYGLISETVQVPAASSGVTTRGALHPAASYRVTVRGVVRLGAGVRSDGQCVRVRDRWYRAASIDRRAPGQDHGNLYVNGVPFSGRSTGSGCDSHEHTATVSPDAAGRLRLQLWDPRLRSDNRGELKVTIQRLTPIAGPKAAGKERIRPRREEWHQRHDWFEVDSSRRAGKVSTMRLRRGERVQVHVRGQYSSHGYRADASCVQGESARRTTLPGLAIEQDPLDVWVEGRPVAWRATGSTPVCSSEYRYAAWFTATKPGPIRVAVFDLDYRDNKGKLQVTLLRERR